MVIYRRQGLGVSLVFEVGGLQALRCRGSICQWYIRVSQSYCQQKGHGRRKKICLKKKKIGGDPSLGEVRNARTPGEGGAAG